MPFSFVNLVPKSILMRMCNLFAPMAKWRVGFFYSVAVLMFIITFSSCKTTYHNSYYFKSIQKDTTIQPFVTENVEAKIRKGDLLSIKVSSLNPQEDLLFNLSLDAGSGSSATAGAQPVGYYVDKQGNIEMHKLGVIHLEGMTLKQVEQKLKKDLSPFLRDIIVTTDFLNHRITVLGEVGRSQQIQLDKTEKISIIDALALSGDITENGDKSNVLIIRETENGKQMKRVNLEDHSVFTTPWFYLQPDDVLYVASNDNKYRESKKSQQQQLLTTISVGASLAILILTNTLRK